MEYSVTAAKLLLITCLIVIFNKVKSCEEPFSNEYEGFCYYIGRQFSKWQRAESDCQSKGSNLASIHSTSEAAFLKDLVKNTGFGWKWSFYWIGFNYMDSDGVFEWTDKTTVDFTYFDVNEPNNFEKQEKCVTMSKINGRWNDDHCNKEFPYICKLAKYTPALTTASAIQDTTIGNCLKGWIPHLDRCYYIGGKNENERLNWTESTDFCDKKGGYLTSIRSSKDQNFLAYLLQTIGEDTWIGFRAYELQFRYIWVDNSANGYTNWGGYTDGHVKTCAKMVYNHVRSGVWIEEYCERKLAFICHTRKDPNIPPLPSNGYLNCAHPEGWMKLNNMCFQLFKRKTLKWDEAELSCNKKGGHLVSVSDPSVNAVVNYLTADLNENFYIGLKYDEKSQNLKWLNNFPATITIWENNEPSFMTDDTCFASTSEGYWQKVQCNAELPYVCQTTRGKPKLKKYVGNCQLPSNSWDAGRNSYCYSMETELNFFKAWTKCQEKGSELLSIHSTEEMEDVKKLFRPGITSIYLGLERNSKGGFRWSDDSPVNFINWYSGGPDNIKDSCVIMTANSMEWTVADCEYKRHFICMSLKSTLVEEDIEIVEISTGARGKTVVPGIILGILISVGLVAFLYYMIRRRKRSDPEGLTETSKKDLPEVTEKMSMRGVISKSYD